MPIASSNERTIAQEVVLTGDILTAEGAAALAVAVAPAPPLAVEEATGSCGVDAGRHG